VLTIRLKNVNEGANKKAQMGGQQHCPGQVDFFWDQLLMPVTSGRAF
jgi:hypothetical protein